MNPSVQTAFAGFVEVDDSVIEYIYHTWQKMSKPICRKCTFPPFLCKEMF